MTNLSKRLRQNDSLAPDTMYYVYMVECADNTLYTGITTNVERRFLEHQKKKGGHYTNAHVAVLIVFTEASK
jgi:putative endonuclease